MTPDEINRAIADHLGWKWKPKGDKYGPLVHPWIDANGTRQPALPSFACDLNAMHEAEKTLSKKQRAMYGEFIAMQFGYDDDYYEGWSVNGYSFWEFAHATAAQRAEAFLRTIGRWKE